MEMEHRKMKKKKYILILGMLCVLMLFGCANTEKEEQQAQQDIYFQIVDEINNGDYSTAFSDMEKTYGNIEYTDSENGTNKMLIYRLYYDKQEKYEDEMNVLLEYLQIYDFREVLATEKASENKENVKFVIKRINEISEKVSDDTRNKVIKIVGQDILDSYK